ncbi:PLP-dependent cysteine synthase family protein [Halarchaeum sp. CBA1220]|uniref:PLP-dependent cysteine synthase family protein n=1 Tax=Halarchaeum sp. CBA1220 TaxID=1853682 RepID=UPI000F3A8416|nr:PLP-dependent cysteine synthase family protein [Halarchaeum sp. CBA1220]QLC32668.1 PLP-dependent cysteine synthase family protein [Halarchaeum sp. CBA1220]
MIDSILDAIGTPLLRLPSPEGATVAAKVESFNPGGSAKDRPAREMVLAAEEAGNLSPGDRIVEATSGNTGIGLAVVSAARGYDLTIVMPADMSQERRNLLRAYGADLELVEGSMTDANERAAEIAAETDAYPIRQFENDANPRAHYRTTAEEILEQVDGRDIDAFVAAVGTGGTITGTSHRLLEEFPDMEVVAVEPEGNAVLSGEEPGEDAFQGMGPGFVSDILDVEVIDTVETVAIDDAEAECRSLAREQGVLVGQSSGAVSLVAQRVAERYAYEADDDEEPLIVTMFWDSGERYLTAGVFD